jgi:hypothetical protein
MEAPSTAGLYRIRQFADRHKHEGWTEPSLRWLIFKSSENGLDKAGVITRLGTRIFIDETKFYTWLRNQRGAA